MKTKKIAALAAALSMVFSAAGALPAQVLSENFSITASADDEIDCLDSGTLGDVGEYRIYSGETINIKRTDGITADTFNDLGTDDPTYKAVDGVVYTKSDDTLFICPDKKAGAVTVADGTKTILDCAFLGCSQVTQVTIPESVTTIGAAAFANCTGLTTAVIPKNVTCIDTLTFGNCSALTSVTIPNSVTYIGNYTFLGCKNLTDIYYDGTQAQWNTIYFGTVDNSLKNAVIHCSDGDFEYAKSSLDSNGVLTIYGSGPFEQTNFENGESIKKAVIKEGITVLPLSIFSNCPNLTEIYVEPGNTSFTSIDGVLYTLNGDGLYRYPCAKEGTVNISDDVTTIYGGSFWGCTGITTMTIPDNVTEIGWGAFEYCTNLTQITLPKGITSIEFFTFLGCSELKAVAIPESVNCIESAAFLGCDNLTDIYYGGTEEQWKKITIENDNDPLDNATIHYLGSEIPEPAPEFVKGDVTGDGKFNTADVITMIAVLKGNKAMPEDKFNIYDWDEGGRFDYRDVMRAIQAIKNS